MKKKVLISIIILFIVIVVIIILSQVMGPNSHVNNDVERDTIYKFKKDDNDDFVAEKETLLPIPPLMESDITLTAQNGEVEFFKGTKTKTRGYNGNILGPTLKLYSGKTTKVNVINEMEEETTVHWHGLLVDSDVDGVFNKVLSKEEVSQNMNMSQPATTAWYHPHTMGKTASQVIEGLAGFIIIEDEISQSINLPKDYGVNDIPVVFQLKGFDSKGQIDLNDKRDYALVNGVNKPTLNVKNEWVRLRLLNGNNDEIVKIGFDQNIDKYIIATDGGFIEKPKQIEDLILAPGERVELLVDLTKLNVGESMFVYTNDYASFKININDEVNSDYTYALPNKLVDYDESDSENLVNREFELSMSHMTPLINGESYSMGKVNEKVKLGSKEVWTVSNKDNSMMAMPHPFHVHGVSFKVLSRDGSNPFVWEEGYKDTILLYPGEKVKLLVEFKNQGKFVYHCHFLEHEEDGMMGNFTVE